MARRRLLRRFPIHPGAVYGLAKEVKAAAEDFRPLLVAGAPGPAHDLHRALTEGGDADAVRDRSGRSLTGYDLDGAGLLVYAIEGDGASPEDDDALRLADRKDVEAVCLLVGPQRAQPVDVPHVLATDVVHVQPGEPLPLALLVERIADRADERGYGFAARLPVLRQAVCESIIGRFSLQNGAIGALVFVPGADLPVLTLNQLRMVFRIAAAYGEDIGRERAFELLAVIGAGLGFRALARQVLAFVPGFGWAVKGGVAYAATRALGEAAVAYFDAGVPKRVQDAVRSRS